MVHNNLSAKLLAIVINLTSKAHQGNMLMSIAIYTAMILVMMFLKVSISILLISLIGNYFVPKDNSS